jgi:GNAT superfamily N-acetyltransferase
MADDSHAIRFATPDDVPEIRRMIVELAEYEKLPDCRASVDALREHLFGERPVCEAIVLDAAGDGEVARTTGFALFFAAYSTLLTSPFLYLEDLYVEPGARGRGFGLALMRELVRIAVERGWPRVQWEVLDWNESAIRFYERCGARILADWRTCRLEPVSAFTGNESGDVFS